MKKNILVVGSLNMDLVVHTPRHPRIGETIIGGSFQTFPGGKGANQAVAAARLGGAVIMVGKVGQDAFGKALLETVARDGVDTSCIKKDDQAASGVALITVSNDGENTIVVASGANALVTAKDIEAIDEIFKQIGILVLQLETPLPTVEYAVKKAKEYGATVVLNPAPACPLPDSLLSSVDYLVPNQTEISLLAGNIESLDDAIQVLRSRGVEHLIVTLGEEGVLIIDGEQRLHIPAYPVKAVDTVAAGDAFVGAFVVALSEGLSLTEAVRWGNAAGAIAVTRPGAQPSLPKREELVKFLAENAG
jgi:ribokinase